MPIARIPLAQKIESRTASSEKDSYSRNCYFETRDGNRELVKRPGLSPVTPYLPDTQPQGLYASLSNLWAATNSTVYQINTGTGAVTSFGSIGSGPVSWNQTSASAGYIFLQDTNTGYYIAPLASSVTQVASGTIASYTITDAGYGYTSLPTAIVTGGGGASATAFTRLGVVNTTIGAAGTGYNVNDVLSFAITGGAADRETELLVTSVGGSGEITGLSVQFIGTYSALPTLYGVAVPVALTGGAGAAATATLYWGVSWVGVTAAGSGYTSVPTVTISDPTAGALATATANVSFFPAAPLARGVVYLDGYTFVATTSGRIYNSGIEDPTTWNALDYISAESEPDPIVGICKHFNYVVAFGQWSTEFFYDKANPSGSPLARNAAARLEIGCANGGSIVQIEQAVLWVGKSRLNGKSVFIMDGLHPVKVSTPWIEKYLNADLTDDVTAFSFKMAGHTFYVMTLYAAYPNAHTFVFDVDEKEWYIWSSVISGVDQGYWTPSLAVESGSYYYAIDANDSDIYAISTGVYQDDSVDFIVGSVTPLLDSGTTKYKFYRKLEIVGDKVSTTMLVRHTDDDYQTWSNWRSVDLSKTRSQLYQLGAGRRRAWQFQVTDNVALRLAACELDFDIGHMEGAPG